MTNGPLDSLPALKMRLGRQVANNCLELEPTITTEREGQEGLHRDQTFQLGLMARSPGQRFNILTFSICFTEQNSRQFSPICTSFSRSRLRLDIKWKSWKHHSFLTKKTTGRSFRYKLGLEYEITIYLPAEAL